jgi:hypothetical protein
MAQKRYKYQILVEYDNDIPGFTMGEEFLD